VAIEHRLIGPSYAAITNDLDAFRCDTRIEVLQCLSAGRDEILKQSVSVASLTHEYRVG
jgi:hypothetical protein